MATEKISLKEYKTKLSNNRMGLWLFILSDAFIFGGLLVTRFSLLGDTRPDLSQLLGLAVTSILLLSSFFMNRGETQIAQGDQKGFLKSIMITLILGIIFLVGVIGVEWRVAGEHGITPSSGQDGAVFYLMTGYHAFHVLTGVAFLFVVYRNGKKGLYSAERHWAVEACAIYWHFVDVAWIFFYPALYLMGTVLN